jgi:hypothetical protein
MGESIPNSLAPGRHQRRMRNYLLNRRFQLKYSAYLMGIAALLSVCLGSVLWYTSEAGIAESRKAVEQGEQVVERGSEVLRESQKVSAVVQMNIVRDPIYGQNPALLEAFRSDAAEQDSRLRNQQRALEAQSAGLKQQATALAKHQRRLLLTLCVVLGVFVVLVGLAGIVVTHRVAGPIYKMKRQIREVGAGKLSLPSPLRRGDELVDFFQAFDAMVRNLRERQEQEIEELERAISTLEPKAEPGELDPLHRLRERMKASLET